MVEKRKIKTLSVSLIILFVLSFMGQISIISSQEQFTETNFELWYYTRAGSRIAESYGLYLKQALAPLGIQVKIIVIPWGYYVGDLLHYNTGHPFDLTYIRFEDGGATPGFMWQYHSKKTSYGQSVYQLHEPGWQEWQTIETGISTEEVDDLLEAIEFELNSTTRLGLITEFNDLFMTKLLYDLPLVARSYLTSIWRGYGGPNNELWDPQEGIIDSRKLGANWTELTAVDRVSNSTHMRLSILSPTNIDMFDPYQSFDSTTSEITRYMHSSLLDFDSNFTAHPGIAWNYYSSYTPEDTYDHDNEPLTPEIGTYQYTWFLGNTSYWPTTTDNNGDQVVAEMVDAQDFVLAYDMLKHPQTVVNGKEKYGPILDYYASTTLFTNDTFTIKVDANKITPDDNFNFGMVKPIPYHLLGGILSLNETQEVRVSDFSDLNPQNSKEWIHWASMEGHSLVGPYDIVGYSAGDPSVLYDGGIYSYRARDDFWFPNEDRIVNYYNYVAFAELEQRFDYAFDVFGPHENSDNLEALYWNFNNLISSQGIETFEYVVIDRVDAILEEFESGRIDAFDPTTISIRTVEDHLNNSNYVVKEQIPHKSAELLVFNLLHDDLKKINVRLAIAHALDKGEMIKIHDGFARPHHSVVWPMHSDWIVPHEINYDYNKSRDLMRIEGYGVLEDHGRPRDTTSLGSDYLLFLTIITTIIITGIRRVRKYNNG